MPTSSYQAAVTPTGLIRRFLVGKKSQSGNAMVEFALIAPAFVGIVCGILEFSGILFAQTLLEGGIREASRYGILGSAPNDSSREAAIQAIIGKNAFGVIDTDQIRVETLAYNSFGAVGQPEPFEDANGNGSYDAGEVFDDINGNGVRDEDQGAAGLGNANEVVLYRLAYDWDIMIPLFEPFFGEQLALEATIAVRNEPFGT